LFDRGRCPCLFVVVCAIMKSKVSNLCKKGTLLIMWEPTIGKWNDDENYDLKEPLWSKLLKLASHHGDIKKLQQILSWFGKMNMYGDYYWIVLIGCFLEKAGVSIEEHVGTSFLSVISEMIRDADAIDECAIRLLKKQNVDEEFIDEFRMQFAEKNDEV